MCSWLYSLINLSHLHLKIQIIPREINTNVGEHGGQETRESVQYFLFNPADKHTFPPRQQQQ